MEKGLGGGVEGPPATHRCVEAGAGVGRAALHAVGAYAPAKASVRGRFNRLMED